MGFEKGRKSRSSRLWLTHDDVAAFSNALEVALPELRWHCIHLGNSPIRHEYATVQAALNCDLGETNDFRHQAYMMLPPARQSASSVSGTRGTGRTAIFG
jgi:hypothetical protein